MLDEKAWVVEGCSFSTFEMRFAKKVSREVAKAFAESEFEKYRIVQDRLFELDFDRHIKNLLEDCERNPKEMNCELFPTETF